MLKLIVPTSTSESISISLRVHVHLAVTKLWLTPSKLTIPVSTPSVKRFSVYAQFDEGDEDETIADISFHPSIKWGVTAGAGSFSMFALGHLFCHSSDIGLLGLKQVTVNFEDDLPNWAVATPVGGGGTPIIQSNLLPIDPVNTENGTVEFVDDIENTLLLSPNIVKPMSRGPRPRKKDEVRMLLNDLEQKLG